MMLAPAGAMRILLLLIIVFISMSPIYSQRIFWTLPNESTYITENTLVILSPFDWDFSGHYLPSGVESIKKLMIFMNKYPEYEFTIKLHTRLWGTEKSNLKLTEMQAKALIDIFKSDSAFKATYHIIPIGSSNPIIKEEYIDYPKDSQYWFFLHAINGRVEVMIESKKK